MQNPLTLPSRAPSSTAVGAGVAAAISQLLMYAWNGYVGLVPLGIMEMNSITVLFVFIGAWVTKERRYYMDIREGSSG